MSFIGGSGAEQAETARSGPLCLSRTGAIESGRDRDSDHRRNQAVAVERKGRGADRLAAFADNEASAIAGRTRGISRSDGRDQRFRRGRSTGERNSCGLLRPLSEASHSTRRHSRAADGAPHQASSTTGNFNFATGSARTLAGHRSRSARGLMVQTTSGNDCLRRSGIGEDVPTFRTSSCGRGGDVS